MLAIAGEVFLTEPIDYDIIHGMNKDKILEEEGVDMTVPGLMFLGCALMLFALLSLVVFVIISIF